MDERTTLTHRRTSLFRRVGWLAVAALATLALVGPAAGPVGATSIPGAIWTSLSDGTTVNANIYAAKSDVYLNGGPQNCGGGGGLPDGDYYFQVTNPSGDTLLSSDAIKHRQVKVVDGYLSGVSGAGNHAVGTANPGCPLSLPVQLIPYADTPNPGGEYSVDLAPVAEVQACSGFDADSPFNFKGCTSTKNDNFKVGEAEPTTPPTEPPTEPPAEQAELIVLKGLDIDGDGDPNTGTILPGEGWTFDVSATGGTPADSQKATGADGSATFVFDVTGDSVVVDVSEELQTDYEFVDAWCLVENELEVGTAGEAEVTDIPIGAGETVVCYFVNTSGGEEEATATPKAVTPPPTDTLGIAGGTGSDSWRIVILAMAGLLAAILLFTPAEKAVTRRRR